MGDDHHSNIIKRSLLRELQQTFQKDVVELIDIYLHDAKRKIANLYKALQEKHLANFVGAARELRLRSIDIGAVRFSYFCLRLEIAAQEARFECLHPLTSALEGEFTTVREALEDLKQN
ncbi:MAG: hypothetical protein JSS07_03705 [Proteobacteria bacterium]|nr:hypothetical protein [Pseudomonadota bacterium]